MEYYTIYRLIDENNNVVMDYENYRDVLPAITPTDTVLYLHYDKDGNEHDPRRLIEYEEFWEMAYKLILFDSNSQYKLYVPRDIRVFYNGWRTLDDWYILQAQENVDDWTSILTDCINRKEKQSDK